MSKNHAQYCRNGHLTNHDPIAHPEDNRKFCSKCGEPTLLYCPNCQDPIEDLGYMLPQAPRFCKNCGQPFPWTERKLNAAQDLIQGQEQLSESERAIVINNLGELVKDSPFTTVAATKVKTFLSKAGPAVTGMFRDVLVDVMSETAKKILFPN
jgi:hypothetical protein